jgi:protoporphyrinogen oxidase
MGKAAVIGAGITGLATAYWLSRHFSVDIYDKAEPGGLAGSLKIASDGYVEKFYHHFFLSDTHLRDLISELGLEGDVIGRQTKMGFNIGGKTYPFATPLDLLKFKPLTPYGKLMFGLTTAYLISLKDWKRLDGMTCREFYAKWRSGVVFEVVWKPLLKAKFGDAWDRIPMSWLWGRVSARGKSRTGATETLLYVKGGFKTLFDRLTGVLLQRGARIIRAAVDEISPSGEGLIVNGVKYDVVVYTGPNPVFPAVAGQIGKTEYFDKVREIDYQGVICALFILDKKLSDTYWLNVVSDGLPFSGVIEHTNFIEPSNYGGRHLAYAFNYVHRDAPLYMKQPDEIVEMYTQGLIRLFPHLGESDISEVHLSKEPYANTIYGLDYSITKPAYATPVKNLYLCNISQIYPEDRNLNNSVRIAREVAGAILGGERH